jgi:quercetin dioxygenase-like cupin family protein
MKAVTAICAVSLAQLWSSAAFAQDPVQVDAVHYKVVLDNPSVRVLKVDYPAGSKSPMHRHPDNIVVALTSAKVRFTMPDGKSQDADLAADTAIYDPAATHSGTILGGGRVEALVIEFKAAAPGKAALPTSRTGMATKTLAEGPRAAAYRATADASFHEPAGSKHDFDQVVISLAPSELALTIDGKPVKTKWARGDVAFIGRGVPHESKSTGGKPVDFVIVAIK